MSSARLDYVHQKLKELAELPAGWYYGDGDPVSSHAIASAKALMEARPHYAQLYRFFPDLDGAIMMEFEWESFEYSIYFEANGSIRVEFYNLEDPDQDVPDVKFARVEHPFLEFFDSIVAKGSTK